MPERGANTAPGGVDAGNQDQAQGADQMGFGQWLALKLGLEQEADQIVARGCAALLHLGFEVNALLLHRRDRRLGIAHAFNQGAVNPVAKQVAIALGHTKHMRNHTHRNMLRVLHRAIALAAVGGSTLRDGVEQRAADGARARFLLGNLFRREGWQQQLARGRVLGWVGTDWCGDRRGIEFVLAHDDAARGKMFGVVGNRMHIVVTRREIGPILEALRGCHRAALA